MVNKLRGAIRVVAITAPAFGGRRTDELIDLAILTGGTAILEDSGREIESVTLEDLGRAAKVTSDRDKTVIIDGKGDPEVVKKREAHIREQIKLGNTDYDKDIKKQRLAKMVGGVAVINVGANTEVELKEKKERVIDAVNATKAAIEEGIVAGGEITLYVLAQRVDGILRNALKEPFKRLLSNAGLEYAEVLQKLSKGYPEGIDVTTGEATDLIKAGIIDPTRVARSALQNAVSVSLMVLTTDVLIVDERIIDK